MKSFLTAFLGALCAILLTIAMTAGVGSCYVGGGPEVEKRSWLVLELTGGITEYDPPGGVLSQVTGGSPETLTRILDNMRKAEVDDRIEGVIFKVASGGASSRAKGQEIRGAIARFLESGKPVHCWAESFGTTDYALLAACPEILAAPTGYMELKGFSATSMHIRDALDKLGVRPQLHKIKDYKSAAEMMMNSEATESAKENRRWIMEDLWQQFVEILEQDRDLGEDKILALMEHAFFEGQEAVDAGLVDRLAYWDELADELKGDDDTLRVVDSGTYGQIEAESLGLKGKQTIAVIHAQGTIMGRQSGVNPMLGMTLGHETIVAELRKARLDEDVAAVIVRVDSPGGDALGSDLMGHEVEVTAAVKPVVISMVDVAASGGYHISYRGTRILADPMTVTGSIGSITGKFNAAGLYEKLGVGYDDSVSKGPMAHVHSDLRDYSEAEWERFTDNHWDGFNRWLRDVAEHRGMTFEEAEQLAHGRVWTGRQALQNGLVDELGDFHRAVEVARELAEIPADDKVTLAHFPKSQSLLESLTGGDAAVGDAARWAVYTTLQRDIEQTLQYLAADSDPTVRAFVSGY
ncbi:hypothetical protein ABI59_19600 [Acidobacteria bacterium Mor1]|nr:hypothetical protein ABI59_19600 [Acidobacteria bacterium Mor1]